MMEAMVDEQESAQRGWHRENRGQGRGGRARSSGGRGRGWGNRLAWGQTAASAMEGFLVQKRTEAAWSSPTVKRAQWAAA